MAVLLVVVVRSSSKPDAGARSEKGTAFLARQGSNRVAVIVLKRLTKQRLGSLSTYSWIADLMAMNGNEPVDTMNLHSRCQGPTKETFIDT
jgi:hypothetical protein